MKWALRRRQGQVSPQYSDKLLEIPTYVTYQTIFNHHDWDTMEVQMLTSDSRTGRTMIPFLTFSILHYGREFTGVPPSYATLFPPSYVCLFLYAWLGRNVSGVRASTWTWGQRNLLFYQYVLCVPHYSS